MDQEMAECFLKSLRLNVFEKGNSALVHEYFAEDLIGNYRDITFTCF